MASLSISRAWDETKDRIRRDGKLYMVVAAALIALPGLIVGVIDPVATRSPGSITSGLLLFVSSLLGLVGQLAIIRMAIGSAVSVGEAIGHGARRMPIYFVAAILVIVGFLLALIPFAVVMYAAGVPVENETALARSPTGMILLLLYFLFVLFVGVRLLMSSPVASEESAGPIEILRRSWRLTEGHWWRLFGFIVLFLIAAGITISVVDWGAGLVAIGLLGDIEPMSAAALFVAVIASILNAVVTVVLAVMLARIYLQLAGRESVDVSVPKSGT